jgi:hypothetical protein
MVAHGARGDPEFVYDISRHFPSGVLQLIDNSGVSLDEVDTYSRTIMAGSLQRIFEAVVLT